jgi:hypothetical protein
MDSFCEMVVYVPAVDGNGLEKEIVAEREREPAQLHSLPEGGHQQRLQPDNSLLQDPAGSGTIKRLGYGQCQGR